MLNIHNISWHPKAKKIIFVVLGVIGLVLMCWSFVSSPGVWNNDIGFIGVVLAGGTVYIESSMSASTIQRKIKQKLEEAIGDQIIEWQSVESDWRKIEQYHVLTRNAEYVVKMNNDEVIQVRGVRV